MLQDFKDQHLTIRKLYWPREILKPSNWRDTVKWRKQRAVRGWSERDTWGGGEYLASVAEGILRYLEREQNPIDWKYYFQENYTGIEQYGYHSLTDVADDIELYIYWQEHQYDDEYDDMRNDDKWAIDFQLYTQLQNAMHFVAENLGHLWW